MLPANDTPEFQALLHEQVEKRRTFAIISHPDAGKTTLTSKPGKRTNMPLLTGWKSKNSAVSP